MSYPYFSVDYVGADFTQFVIIYGFEFLLNILNLLYAKESRIRISIENILASTSLPIHPIAYHLTQ